MARLNISDQTNQEMRKEIQRLNKKLLYMDELHTKQKKKKIEYGKILSQLEDSEM